MTTTTDALRAESTVIYRRLSHLTSSGDAIPFEVELLLSEFEDPLPSTVSRTLICERRDPRRSRARAGRIREQQALVPIADLDETSYEPS